MSAPSSGALAGLLIAAIPHLNRLGLPAPIASKAIAATAASRTTAYKAKAAVESVLPDLLRPPGRPSGSSKSMDADTAHKLRGKLLDFVYANPGCVSGDGARRRYSHDFCCFALELAAERRDVSLADFAKVTRIPLGTLKAWVAGERPQVDPPKNLATITGPTIPQVETVLNAFEAWDGDFKDFCSHVQHNWRVGLSRRHISDILEFEGVRIPKRRGRPPDASALLGGFETFFSGAQWVGDGTQLEIELWRRRYLCNLELNVDAHSAAFVGASLRPTEDGEAVVAAFADGVANTGSLPIALLLDNKSSNHTDEVEQATSSTIRIRSRLYTATDKPQVEGAFGLFKNTAPPLVITAVSEGELAGEILAMVIATWFRAKNHEPRADRGGKSRVGLYQGAAPTDEEKAEARRALQARKRKNDKARETRAKRQDPLVRASLDEAFERLGLDDPEAVHRTAIASWPFDAILAGIAIWEGKKRRGTLPEGVDGRYLRGIVKNVAEEASVWEMGAALLDERLRARDRALRALASEREALEDPLVPVEPDELLRRNIKRAMAGDRRIDRLYWLRAAADVVLDIDESERRGLLRIAVRHISTTHSVRKSDRDAAVRFLLAKAVTVS